MEREFRLSRRRFLQDTGIFVASTLLGSQAPLPQYGQQELLPIPEKEPTMFSVLGYHDAPDIGGSLNIPLALSDTQRLGGKSLVLINPREEIVQAATAANLLVITRWYNEANLFDEHSLQATIQRSKKYQDRPIIQPFNEVNLPQETKGVYRPPEEQVREHLLPAAKSIIRQDGIVLLPPLAQDALAWEDNMPLDEFTYFDRMLTEMSHYFSPEDLQQYFGLGVHAYIMEVGQDIFPRLQTIQSIATQRLGTPLPLYITEAGVHPDVQRKCSEATTASETKRLLQTPMLQELPIASFDLWVLANKAQRRPARRTHQNEVDSFEPAALRKRYGETFLFHTIEAYAQAA